MFSSKVAFDRTHLIGNVAKILLVQQEGVNRTVFGPENKPGILEKRGLYAVCRTIERADSQCANISLKCKDGSSLVTRNSTAVWKFLSCCVMIAPC